MIPARRQAPSTVSREGRLGTGRAFLLGILLAATPSCGGEGSEGERRPLRQNHENGALAAVGEQVLHEGEWVKDGEVTFYFDDGETRRAVGQYSLGIESGWWTEWYEDGTRAEGQYRNGRREGTWIYWHATGNKQEEGDYVAGERVGDWSWWYPDGKKRGLAAYVDGKIHGRRTDWRRDGSVNRTTSGEYAKGEKVGD